MGRQVGRLLEVREVDIHGARFYDVLFALDSSPQQRRTARIGPESAYPNPQAGDLISAHMVLGQLTRIEKRS